MGKTLPAGPNGTVNPRLRSGIRLGTSMRGVLADAYHARGHGRSGLWLTYSPKADKDVVLKSDIEFGHFLLVESDPDVVNVDYAPARRLQTYAGEGIATIVDAELTLSNGTVVWREVKCSEDVENGATGRANLQLLIQIKAAEAVAARHELITEKEIYANPMRIRNWMRIVPWLAQAREWPLHAYVSEVAALMRTRGNVVLADVLNLGDSRDSAIYAAALFRAVQRGRYGNDLAERPLTSRSVFRLQGGRDEET